MTILVTGSAGHLGEALMRTLRASGPPARGLDIKPSPFTDAVGSICDAGFVADAMRGVHSVLHAATLHKPHIFTHSNQEFVDTNVKGTLILLEQAIAAGIDSFIYTSTTSAFGSALTPAAGQPAAWITEDVAPVPKNIYGVTKVAAESLCELFFRKHALPVLVLRTSRFFPEPDDDEAIATGYETPNAQANEFLYRRVDIEDVVTAHTSAMNRARAIGFRRYVISATTPFRREDLTALRRDAPEVVRRLFPRFDALYANRGWRMFPSLDRVYVNDLAQTELSWRPRYNFAHVLDCLERGVDFRSDLARDVGSKGYHAYSSIL